MAETSENLKKALKIFVGLIIIVIGVFSYTLTWWGGTPWWQDLITLIKGGIGLIIVFIGLIFMLIGWSE